MSEDREEQRGGLRGWHIALSVVGLVLVLIVLLLIVQKGSVKRQLEALRAQGHPTSFAELAEQHPLPKDAENAADVYMDAFAAFMTPTDMARTIVVGEAPLPVAGTPLPQSVASATEQFLLDNQPCLELLRQAGAIEHCRYDWDYVQGMPFLPSLKHCAQLLGAAIVSRGHQDDAPAVLAYLEDELHLIRSLENEPGLIGYLVRVACTALSLRALEQTLSATSFTDEQLAEMSRMLAEAALTLDVTQTMVSERCFMIEYIRDPSKLGTGGSGALRIPVLGGFGLADILDYMADCIAASELPPSERVVRFRQIHDELEDLSFLHTVVKVLAPALGRVAELDLRCQAHLDLTRTALAIERCRLATGKVPEQLEALVPQYLDTVPLDPFDGQPIRYRRTDASYRLYSITDDGQDNGGLSRDEVNKGDPYDLCFIVAR